ncbi:hypothetical protein HN014_04150 [Aquimarina sp. TRL1]|uniref:hypothetical protein n=1 Tax=Aquimarina sp. (strain TRL1) TaxID=2736252 RepID=UPI00158B5B00|nr:hypothetical protein [Aquimarina sp. TRL1]QKX04130.1 hypothetical protein HN014_04150 [Aquimarina sp. TRL1]
MIRTNDLIIVGVGIGVSLLAVYLIKGQKKKPEMVEPVLQKRQDIQEIKESEPIVKVTTEEASYATSSREEKPWLLSRGSKGKEVERLQIWLLRHHGWKGTITKVFDQQTERLVQKVFKADSIDRATYEKHQMGIPIHELIKA